MGLRLVLLVACALAVAARPVSGQGPGAANAAAQPAAAPEGVALLLDRLEALLQKGDRAGFGSLVDTAADPEQVELFGGDLFVTGALRVVVNERDRLPLENSLPGNGYRIVVEIFTETSGRARIVTALLDVRRPNGSGADAWRITAAQGLTSVEGLYRLRIDPAAYYDVRGLTITGTDLVITLDEGSVFVVDSEAGMTGMVLFGRGLMRFSPTPETERGQLRIFAGSDTLSAAFDAVYVRLHPSDYGSRVSFTSLTPARPSPRQLRRAQDVFARESLNSYSLDLRDLSGEPWYLLPQPGELLAEVQTRRHGDLTYSRSITQAEDVTLFDRERRRTISLYTSAERAAVLDRAFNDDDYRDYDVLDYNIEATVSPEPRIHRRTGAAPPARTRAGPVGADAAACRLAGRDRDREPGVRTAPAPAHPESEQRHRQPAGRARARHGDDAHRRVFRPRRTAER